MFCLWFSHHLSFPSWMSQFLESLVLTVLSSLRSDQVMNSSRGSSLTMRFFFSPSRRSILPSSSLSTPKLCRQKLRLKRLLQTMDFTAQIDSFKSSSSGFSPWQKAVYVRILVYYGCLLAKEHLTRNLIKNVSKSRMKKFHTSIQQGKNEHKKQNVKYNYFRLNVR